MNFLDLCKTVKREIGLSGDGPNSVLNQTGQLAQLVGFVQSADMLIQNLWTDWNFLWAEWEVVTVAETESYAIPSDFGEWDYESFWLNWGEHTAQQLTPLTEKEDLKNSGARKIDTPLNVIILPDNNIKLFPVPDGVYTLSASYYKVPVMMTENTDVSAIPSQFHRAIIARAKMLYAEAEEIYDQMMANRTEYEETLDKLEAYALPAQRYHRFAQTTQLVVRPV